MIKLSKAHTADGRPRVGLFHPSLEQERKTLFKMVMIGFIGITIGMYTLLPLYYGAYYKQEENLYRLTVRIVDLDSALSTAAPTLAPTAILGPTLVSTAKKYLSTDPHPLGWQFQSDVSSFALASPGSPEAAAQPLLTRGVNVNDWAQQKVLDQDVWGVVVIHPNATSAALRAFREGDAHYENMGTVSFWYEEARNFETVDSWLVDKVQTLLSAALADANAAFAREYLNQVGVSSTVASSGSINFTALATASNGNAISGPFWYNMHNLRPFDQMAAIASTTAASIYLIIFTFFVSLFWSRIFGPVAPKIKLSSSIALRIGVPVLGYFWLSLCYSLVSLAFQVNFSRFYGHVGFFIYWLNWCSMIALGLMMELMLLLIGPLFFPFFLLFWVIIQVSGAFIDLADQDHFYLYNYILPIWNQVDASKSLIFGTKNHMPQNFLVILGWIGADCVLLSLLAVWRRGQEVKAAQASAGKGAEGEKGGRK